MMISVYLLSDMPMYRESLLRALGDNPRFVPVGSAGIRDDMRAGLENVSADIVLVDVSNGNALGIIRELTLDNKETCLVAIGVPETEQDILDCVEAGASAFVERSASLKQLEVSIEGIARGELICQPHVAAMLSRRVSALARNSQDNKYTGSLTPRELEIIELIDLGSSNKEIARRLDISVSTVKNHVHSILEKLHVCRRGQAAAVVRDRT